MRTSKPTRWFIVVLAICFLAASVAVADDLPEVLRIVNGAAPEQGVETITLQEMWRAGGADDEDVIFGVVNQAMVDDDNNIYLLDTQLSEVKVFSPEGELINTLGREGDGPGEFRNPGDMCFLPDGTLGVLQGFPGKVIKLNMDGTPAGDWTLGDPTAGGFYMMQTLRQRSGNVVAGGTQQLVDQSIGEIRRISFISSLDEQGMRDKDYTTSEVVMKFTEIRLDEMELIDTPDRRYDVGADGRIVAAIPRYGYEISVYSPDGTLEFIFSREYESWKRDERAAGIWQRIFETIQNNQAPGAPISIEDREPDVEFLRVADDGTIWVLTSRAMWDTPDGIFTELDVFSPQGRFIKQVQVVCEGDPREDFLIYDGGEMAFMVTGFWDAALARFGGAGASIDEEEAEPMAVVCYQVR